MFGRSKKKDTVLSQSDCVPLNAAMLALKVLQRSSAPLFNRGEVVLKDVAIKTYPFAQVVDAEGGKVHDCTLNGHYEADGIGGRVSHHFAASFFVRLYENGKVPCLAHEGTHELTLNCAKYRVRTESPTRLKLGAIDRQGVVINWCHSDDIKRLEELPCPEVHATLYSARIRTLGHLKAWNRSQLLEATGDTSAVAGAEKILAHFGATFKPE